MNEEIKNEIDKIISFPENEEGEMTSIGTNRGQLFIRIPKAIKEKYNFNRKFVIKIDADNLIMIPSDFNSKLQYREELIIRHLQKSTTLSSTKDIAKVIGNSWIIAQNTLVGLEKKGFITCEKFKNVHIWKLRRD